MAGGGRAPGVRCDAGAVRRGWPATGLPVAENDRRCGGRSIRCYVSVVAHVAPVQSWLRLLVTDGHDWADPPSFPLAGDMTRFVWITVSDGDLDLPKAIRSPLKPATRERSKPTLT